MKLAVAVQRYGADINGGAELHARYIAERLSRHADVQVLTTCARDYVTWRNEYEAGDEQINGVAVRRFPVTRERDVFDFARRSSQVFDHVHSLHDELAWLESEGPCCPALVDEIARRREEFDAVLLFSARYYHAYHGARAAGDRAVMVPTAEREPSLGLSMFGPLFRGVRAVMYNSPEEQAMIAHLTQNTAVPGVVVGVGSDVPTDPDPGRARRTFGLNDPFIVYVGRIDANKGCAELFDFFLSYLDASGRAIDLVLVGTAVMPVPAHPRIRHLGFVGDADKFDVIAAAEMLVMPSPYESLSMVSLEAWALGRPVLANARCDVLVGQCRRSNAGLYYADHREFAAAVDRLLDDAALAAAMAANGRTFYDTHYIWPLIERKYLDMFEHMRSHPTAGVEPLPGPIARRRRTLPPAAARLAAAPAGPVTSAGGAFA